MRCLTSGTEIHRVSLLHHSSTAGRGAKIAAGTSAEAGQDTALAFWSKAWRICYLGYRSTKHVFLSSQACYLTFKRDHFFTY